MYVCVYVCMYAMYVCMYVCMYACMYVGTNVCTVYVYLKQNLNLKGLIGLYQLCWHNFEYNR